MTLATHSSPGGGSDVFLREMAPHLSRIMGVTFVVDNLQGGSGAKAMAIIARREAGRRHVLRDDADVHLHVALEQAAAGYTDLEPLVNIFFDPEVLYTAADSRFKTLQDVLDQRAKGGGKWGAANPASLERQALERLKQKAMVAAVVITFEGGGDMLINVLNHTLDMGIGELQEIRGAARRRNDSAAGGGRRSTVSPLFPISRPSRSKASISRCASSAGLRVPRARLPTSSRRGRPPFQSSSTIRNTRSSIWRTACEPGFIPHAEYVRFMSRVRQGDRAFLERRRSHQTDAARPGCSARRRLRSASATT